MKKILISLIVIAASLEVVAQTFTAEDYKKAGWMTLRFYGGQRSSQKSLEGPNWLIMDHEVSASDQSGLSGKGFKASAYKKGYDFTNDADVFANSQLARLKADGGGDEKESAIDALWYALKRSDWRPRCTKVLVLFTDAGTKGLHSKTMDELGVVDDIAYLQQELMKNRIQLFMYCKTDPVYEKLHQVERAHVYQYDNPGSELLKSDFAELLKVIGKTVSASIASENKTL